MNSATDLSVEDLKLEDLTLDEVIQLEVNPNEQKLELSTKIYNGQKFILLCLGELVLNLSFLVYITAPVNSKNEMIVSEQFTAHVECILKIEHYKEKYAHEQLTKIADRNAADFCSILIGYTNNHWQPVLKTVQDMNTSLYEKTENNFNLVKLLAEQPEIVIELLALFNNLNFTLVFKKAKEDDVIKKIGKILETWSQQYNTLAQRNLDIDDTNHHTLTFWLAWFTETSVSVLHESIKDLLLDQDEWNVYCGRHPQESKKNILTQEFMFTEL